jgi:hypothetical protein
VVCDSYRLTDGLKLSLGEITTRAADDRRGLSQKRRESDASVHSTRLVLEIKEEMLLAHTCTITQLCLTDGYVSTTIRYWFMARLASEHA